MVKMVHKYGDAEVGDIVSLKSGGPEATLVRFVPVDSPAIPDGIQNTSYADSALLLNAAIMWIAADGSLGQAVVPVSALVFKDGPADGKKPAQSVL